MKNKQLDISGSFIKSGFQVGLFNDGQYAVKYPPAVFKALPAAGRRFLADSFIYSRTRPLTLLDRRLNYRFPRPFFKNFIDFGIKKTLPCLGEINNLAIPKLIKNFGTDEKSGRVNFIKGKADKTLPALKTFANRAVLSISFGKDSVLSYGVAKELGLNLMLVTANEMENTSGDEWKIKSKIISDFSREQKEKVYLFSDNVDELYYHQQIKSRLAEVNNTNGLLAYALELLPFVYYHRARYLFFGNEQNLNDFYFTPGGFKFYPSFDQSSAYTAKENLVWQKAVKGKFKVASLVEPLYNLAEFKILFHRYPWLLKYVISCEPYKGSPERWCYHCPMCAKAFLYSCAVSGDPKQIAFNRNFFAKKYAEFYPLFSKKPLRNYERPPQVKEEQILAFLLCFRAGWRGPLIDLFKKKYLAEAQASESRLRRKFFGIHQAINLPASLKEKILKIYQEELSSLSQ